MYLVYLSYSTQAKNALEKAFAEYLSEINRMLIPDEEIETAKQEILDKYQELCKIHHRCKPIEKSFYNYSGDEILHGSNQDCKLLKANLY